jgi:hypothetical protein
MVLPLTTVSHEHHDVLWSHVNRLDELADCLNADCLDSVGLIGHLPQLREAYDGLANDLLPHMDAVEAAVHPTLERIMVDHDVTVPMGAEHAEIRRLVTGLAVFVDEPETHQDRVAVLGLRRILLRLHALLKVHLAEEELYIPILEDRLTAPEEQALARALNHLASTRV